jgi:hypothetical protein
MRAARAELLQPFALAWLLWAFWLLFYSLKVTLRMTDFGSLDFGLWWCVVLWLCCANCELRTAKAKTLHRKAMANEERRLLCLLHCFAFGPSLVAFAACRPICWCRLPLAQLASGSGGFRSRRVPRAAAAAPCLVWALGA